mgnify:CR=1 FL=1
MEIRRRVVERQMSILADADEGAVNFIFPDDAINPRAFIPGISRVTIN